MRIATGIVPDVTRLKLTLFASAALGAVFLLPATAPAAASVACPKAPAGWTLAAGRSALGTAPSDQVRINCHYAASTKKAIDVVLAYAVPYTPNAYTVTTSCTTSTGTPLKSAQAWN